MSQHQIELVESSSSLGVPILEPATMMFAAPARPALEATRRNRNRLIALQVVGGLSILVWPVVLIANIMAIAAPGHTVMTSLPWVLLSFYPLVWAALFWFSWRAMRRGAAGLAFAMSSIPAFACLLVFGVLIFNWIVFLTGIAGGGLHSRTYP